mmetsp:Transcript_70041/g.141028  ORF Transcript_70041/g.141028 Transcript_70041/m.141028 type:complete len:288 (-) Transcript_70041:465-1328(-)
MFSADPNPPTLLLPPSSITSSLPSALSSSSSSSSSPSWSPTSILLPSLCTTSCSFLPARVSSPVCWAQLKGRHHRHPPGLCLLLPCRLLLAPLLPWAPPLLPSSLCASPSASPSKEEEEEEEETEPTHPTSESEDDESEPSQARRLLQPCSPPTCSDGLRRPLLSRHSLARTLAAASSLLRLASSFPPPPAASERGLSSLAAAASVAVIVVVESVSSSQIFLPPAPTPALSTTVVPLPPQHRGSWLLFSLGARLACAAPPLMWRSVSLQSLSPAFDCRLMEWVGGPH